MRRAVVLASLVLVACGSEPRTSSPLDGGARPDAELVDSGVRPGPYDYSCEPDPEPCETQAEACAGDATTEGMRACRIAYSECYVAAMRAAVPCLESYGCSAGVTSIECAESCEAEARACYAVGVRPGDMERCRERTDACQRETCGIDPWRSTRDNLPPCR